MTKLTAKILTLLVIIFIFLIPTSIFAQEDSSICQLIDIPYPQCGGTLGLEDKPVSHTYMVTRIRNSCTNLTTYQNVDLGELGQCPSNQCPSVVQEYGQCGATVGLENYPPSHTIRVRIATDCNGKISYQNSDLGDQGECTTTSSTYSVSGNGGVTTKVVAKESINTSSLTPNQNNCQGRYAFFKTSLGNFGDPGCNFSKDELYTQLKELDPANADFWFYTIIRCESNYDPNNFNPNAIDSAGAWGLFQMGRGKNGQYDHGDVNWTLQTSNAVNYNNKNLRPIGLQWAYWACTRGH